MVNISLGWSCIFTTLNSLSKNEQYFFLLLLEVHIDLFGAIHCAHNEFIRYIIKGLLYMEIFPLFRCISEKEIHQKHMGKNTPLPVSIGQSECCLKVKKTFKFICYIPFCLYKCLLILANGGLWISRNQSKTAEKSDCMLQYYNLAVQDFPTIVYQLFRRNTCRHNTNLFANYEA